MSTAAVQAMDPAVDENNIVEESLDQTDNDFDNLAVVGPALIEVVVDSEGTIFEVTDIHSLDCDQLQQLAKKVKAEQPLSFSTASVSFLKNLGKATYHLAVIVYLGAQSVAPFLIDYGYKAGSYIKTLTVDAWNMVKEKKHHRTTKRSKSKRSS